MQRLKNTGNIPMPRPTGNLFAGMMIGSIIMTIATHAIVLGAGAAMTGSTLKRN